MPEKYSEDEARLEASLLETRRDQFGETYTEGEQHVDKDTQIVIDILNQAKERITSRESLMQGLSEEQKNQKMNQLREAIFGRRETGEAFHELSDQELAFLEDAIANYIKEGRLKVVDRDIDELIRSYRVIRHDLLTGREEIKPDQFREASNQITKIIFKDVVETYRLKPDKTVVLLPWRAGLAFGQAAVDQGFSNFYHLGAKRNEQTLQTEIYYEEASALIDQDNPENNKDIKVVIADPMLATGNTMIDSIERLKKMGIKEDNIIITSVISAPEGIDHIISRFPKAQVTIGSHDEKLNNTGYIVPGLGDFGDKHFAELGEKNIDLWKRAGILNPDSEAALYKKINQS